MTGMLGNDRPADRRPFAGRRLTLAKVLALVAVWGVACAWPKWLGLKLPMLEPWWAAGALAAAFIAVPVGLPLSLLVLRGRAIVPWLATGFAAAAGIAIYHYVRLTQQHWSSDAEGLICLAIAFGGLGAACGGCVGMCATAVNCRRKWMFSLWATLAVACAADFLLLRHAVLFWG